MADVLDAGWPQQQDYDDSMQMMLDKVRDSAIKYGRLERDQTGTIMRFGGANNYVTLYKVDDWMIRCFCQDRGRRRHPPIDIETRYKLISEFCQRHAKEATSLVPVEYMPDAIEVDIIDRQTANYVLLQTESFPLVRMKYIEGFSLGTFIAKYYTQRTKMEKLCVAWLCMIQELEQLQMAHGDLDLTNVLVMERNDQIILKLIDYDNAWIPAFTRLHLAQVEIGHEHFQHPAFASKKTRPFDKYMDRFSALTIYISLNALALNPTLYTDPAWGVSDAHLLFTKSDYEAEMQSLPNHISLLADQHISQLALLLQELRLCLQECRQPKSLTELPSTSMRKAQAVLFPQIARESSVFDETELVYFDWSQAKIYEDANKVPLRSLEPIRLTSPSQTTWVQPEPDAWAPSSHVAQQQQQQIYQDQLPIENTSSSKSIIVWSIVGLVLLCILVVILVIIFTHAHLPLSHVQPLFTFLQQGKHVAQILMLPTSRRV